MFKEFNSHYLLNELPTHRAPVVEALILSCIMMLPVRHGLLVACAAADWNGPVSGARRAIDIAICRRRSEHSRSPCTAGENRQSGRASSRPMVLHEAVDPNTEVTPVSSPGLATDNCMA